MAIAPRRFFQPSEGHSFVKRLTPRWQPGLLALLLFPLAGMAGDAAGVVAAGRKVTLEYTLTLPDGSVAQSTAGSKPFTYQQGSGQIVPGLEKALAGLKAGEQKKVTLAPEEAYGPVLAENRREVPIDRIPEEARHVGAELSAQGFPGAIRVAEIRKDTAVLDFNHPLAGKTLTFDVRVVSVK